MRGTARGAAGASLALTRGDPAVCYSACLRLSFDIASLIIRAMGAGFAVATEPGQVLVGMELRAM